MAETIYPSGNGSWKFVLEMPRGADGKRKQKWFTFKGTKGDARKERTRLMHEIDTGRYIQESDKTLSEYLKYWLANYAKINVTPKTYERYEDTVRLHLIPALGHYRLSKLLPQHIQEYYALAVTSGRIDGKGGLSKQTVLHHHRILKKALKDGVNLRMVPYNPADSVQPYRVDRQEMKVLNPQEINRLLEVTKETVYHMPIMLAAMTGIRRGEILGLKWKDIDLEESLVTVVRSLTQTRAGMSLKDTKTAKSRRTIVLPDMAVNALKEYKEKQESLFCSKFEPGDLVFSDPDGKPVVPKVVSDNFRYMLKRANLPHMRFHDLRHSHASILMSEGVHPKVVSERLGHTSIGITMDIYSHLMPNMQKEAACKLNKAFQAVSSNNSQDID